MENHQCEFIRGIDGSRRCLVCGKHPFPVSMIPDIYAGPNRAETFTTFKPTVVELKKPVRQEVVTMAREALAMALNGELVSLGYFATRHDGCVDTNFSATDNKMLELAAVERLRHRMHLAMDLEGMDTDTDMSVLDAEEDDDDGA